MPTTLPEGPAGVDGSVPAMTQVMESKQLTCHVATGYVRKYFRKLEEVQASVGFV